MKLLVIIKVKDKEVEEFHGLKSQKFGQQPYIYICKQYACHKPVKTSDKAMQLLRDI